ncbi:MAG: ribonuclease E/G, partial [Comamonas sp.]
EGRRERQNRNPEAQPAMQPVADEATMASAPIAQAEGTEAQGQDGQGDSTREPRQRRSRDRYGRDRRDRAPRETQAEGQTAEMFAPSEVQEPVAAPAAPAVADAGEQPARRSYFDTAAAQAQTEQAPAATQVQAPVTAPVPAPAPAIAPVEAAVAAPVAAPAPVAQAVVTEVVAAPVVQAQAPVAVAAPAPAPAVVAAPAPAAVKAEAYDLPIPALQALAAASGLQWINSDAEKIAAVQAAIAAEPKPVRIPRERPAPVVHDEGPLILVETRKDLSLMQLPFEKEEQAAGHNA